MYTTKAEEKDTQTGLTLIEVLAALLLLSLISASIPVIFGTAARWISQARMETTAVAYGVSILDNLRAEREKLDQTNTGKTAEKLYLGGASPYPGITGEITKMQPQLSFPNLYEVTLTITWFQSEQTHNLVLSTVIRKNQR